MAHGEFHKMHGLGNDFVIIDGRMTPIQMTPAKARAIADRQLGIGCDQLIVLDHSNCADVSMSIYNSDGSEVESCGNASRCVVALLAEDVRIETKGGIISGKLDDHAVTIDMGIPRFEWQDIPLAFAMDTSCLPLAWDDLKNPSTVNIGNPHAVFFVDDANAVDLEDLGPLIEHDAAFPERVNVNVASIVGGEINLRVWERGAGLTRACGTGACATGIVAIRQGKVQSPVKVNLPGGQLLISWKVGQTVVMSGSATYVFKGYADWDQFE